MVVKKFICGILIENNWKLWSLLRFSQALLVQTGIGFIKLCVTYYLLCCIALPQWPIQGCLNLHNLRNIALPKVTLKDPKWLPLSHGERCRQGPIWECLFPRKEMQLPGRAERQIESGNSQDAALKKFTLVPPWGRYEQLGDNINRWQHKQFCGHILLQ